MKFAVFFKSKRKNLLFFILTSISPYVFLSINVNKSLNKDAIEIAKLLDVDKQCSNLNSFDREIECIKNIQRSQFNLVKGTDCRGKFINLGSKQVLSENTACCFDRSRIIEQSLQFYGFKVRHVFLIQSSNLGLLTIVLKKSYSHAATEVLTSKGWLGVDSNEPFILIDKNKLPNTYPEAISNGLLSKLTDNIFYKKPIIYIIDLYSRNGTFFEPYIPYLPEINIINFIKNIPNIKITNPI